MAPSPSNSAPGIIQDTASATISTIQRRFEAIKATIAEDLGAEFPELASLAKVAAGSVLGAVGEDKFHLASEELQEIISKCYYSPNVLREPNSDEHQVYALLSASNVVEFLQGYYNRKMFYFDDLYHDNIMLT